MAEATIEVHDHSKPVSKTTMLLVVVGVGYVMYKIGQGDAMVKFQRAMIDSMLIHIDKLTKQAGV